MITANWHVVSDKLVIASIQKNASTSMTKVFPELINAEKALTFEKRIMWIRNPLSRLLSAFTSKVVPELPDEWKDFIEYVLKVDNVHWYPQVKLVTYDGIFVPNIVNRFEDIENTWPEYVDKKLPKINVSKDVEYYPLNHRREDIIVRYAEDFNCWAEAK